MTRPRFTIDARIPLRFGPLDSRNPGEAVLTDGPQAPSPSAAFTPDPASHPLDCACCTPRSAAATALATLFRDRAVSTSAPFRTVLAVVAPGNQATVRDAVANDPVASMRYRLQDT